MLETIAEVSWHGLAIVGDQDKVMLFTPVENSWIECAFGRGARITDYPDRQI